MGDVVDYYRLMAAWLLHLASPSSLGVDDVDLPLPLPPPRDFRTLPVMSLLFTPQLCRIRNRDFRCANGAQRNCQYWN